MLSETNLQPIFPIREMLRWFRLSNQEIFNIRENYLQFVVTIFGHTTLLTNIFVIRLLTGVYSTDIGMGNTNMPAQNMISLCCIFFSRLYLNIDQLGWRNSTHGL